MAKIEFTVKEVIDALPRESKYSENPGVTGSARAWQIFSSKEGADEAAVMINDTIVTALTQPFEADLRNLTDEIDGFAGNLSSLVAKRLRAKYGHVYGFNDTEPRTAMHFFICRLFGDDSRY